MVYSLQIPTTNGAPISMELDLGQVLFVLGANGTGKSTLLHAFYSAHPGASRISAHRQTWLRTNGLTLAPQQQEDARTSIRGEDRHPDSRWKDDNAAVRTVLSIASLVDSENKRARFIANAIDGGDVALAQKLAQCGGPLSVINTLLRLSNLGIEIAVSDNQRITATKRNQTYSVAELSDGERNALLLAADVLNAAPQTLILIDEPERHLHRSIISPLLTQLFNQRKDCGFVISTHETLLPVDNPEARTLLVRSAERSPAGEISWDADLLERADQVPDEVRRDILGARRKILFVEGEDHSLDRSLYQILFPDFTVVAKTDCREVDRAVSGLREAVSFHWVRAFGVVDNDQRSQEDLNRLRDRGVFALPMYSVESVYYHAELMRRVAVRFANLVGADPDALTTAATSAALTALQPHSQRLSERIAEKAIRESLLAYLPKRGQLSSTPQISARIDVAGLVQTEKQRFDAFLAHSDLPALIARYPVRETSALQEIASKLGFQTRTQYQEAVRTLLLEDWDSAEFVRSLLGELSQALVVDEVDEPTL